MPRCEKPKAGNGLSQPIRVDLPNSPIHTIHRFTQFTDSHNPSPMPDYPAKRPRTQAEIGITPETHRARLTRLRRLSFFLDNAIEIPILRRRIGLDPLIGLIPGGGDIAGMVLSCIIVLEAARMGAKRSVLMQMAGNVLLETVVGTVPMAGDVFDAAWKANARNVQLLESSLNISPSEESVLHQRFAFLLIVGLFVALIASLVLSALILRWVVQAIGGV
jgi:hypothetical protein